MAVSYSPRVTHPLDALLELVCIDLQLSETQDGKARGHYHAVAEWLSKEGSPLRSLSPHIFPQGSQRLGTTTKPVGRSEFDLDAICKLSIGSGCHPGELYQLIWDRLGGNGMYRPMMRRMPRCIRLEYAGDFHLDIAPAIPDEECGGTCLLVPDLDADLALSHPKNDRWKSTNPQGYADWVEDRCVPVWALTEKFARAQVDPVPDREASHAKPALKRCIQLFKRWRDIEYLKRPSLAPPSIILTTLSGLHYEGQQSCTESMTSILDAIADAVLSGERICLTNPAHSDENICEKWDSNPDAYLDFAASVTTFRDRWERLQMTQGIHQIENELSELFGASPVHSAIRNLTERNVVEPRQQGRLSLVPGVGLLVPAVRAPGRLKIPTNTFHGD